jgi:dipeptidyl aminopeptidase/acylaminoacyl peptidase
MRITLPERFMRVSSVALLLLLPAAAVAQGTATDYKRADSLNKRYEGLAVGVVETTHWLPSSSKLWYRKTVAGGNVFVLVDVPAGTKAPAFDHARVAAAISNDSAKFTAATLPFITFDYLDNETAIGFVADHSTWRCALDSYQCARTGPAPTGGRGGRGGAGPNPAVDEDSLPDEGPSTAEVSFAEETRELFEQPGPRGASAQPRDSARVSPDGTMEAVYENYNIYLRRRVPAGKEAAALSQLSFDGRASSPYSLQSVIWSPDSKKIFATRVTPGDNRMVHYVLSSPPDQLQPKDTARTYDKPGDARPLREPAIFDVATGNMLQIDHALFPNAYLISQFHWSHDSRAVTFEYNQRGHQVYRVIAIDATTGAARAVIDERSPTFIYYNGTNDGLSSGKHYRYDVSDGKEIIWMSERDGWNHLYLYDGATGRVKNQITRGNWVVRNVERVDTVARQIYFAGNGMNAGEDPYLLHYYRINFDGTGLTPLTPAKGNHAIAWSPDGTLYTDTYSQVDAAPVSEIRRAADQSLVMTIETPDVAALTKAGWRAPEVFVSKARDGATDIWGVIYRPSNFNPKKKYPVIENIYAGPQGSFVPKTWSVNNPMRNLAELGFIVVQIDGMGTSNRSKAFHDVAFKNLADAGFPDRILWHRTVAAKYPSYDISRVGIYGTSAGGQNALGGLLFHPEFYKAGFAAAGCHDNRMDKMWWNEQWMGWPIGPQYAASSNTEHAANLQGKLLLVVGEYDTNVDPSSTMQVVNALIKANKMFDLLVIPGADHTNGGPYGTRKMSDFFVHNLLGVETPDRNAVSAQAGPARAAGR